MISLLVPPVLKPAVVHFLLVSISLQQAQDEHQSALLQNCKRSLKLLSFLHCELLESLHYFLGPRKNRPAREESLIQLGKFFWGYTLSEAWSGVNWAEVLAAAGGWGTVFVTGLPARD